MSQLPLLRTTSLKLWLIEYLLRLVIAQVAKIWLNFNPISDRLSVNALSGPVGHHLLELYLGACELRALPDGLLAGLGQLVVLHLWGNNIQLIPNGFFRSTRSLRELVLWGNQISDVDKDTFVGLWKLRRLDLDHNKITQLDKEMFRHMSELQVRDSIITHVLRFFSPLMVVD